MFYGFGYGSSTQYILYLLGILLAVIAQGWLSSTYSKYRAVANARGLSGAECARHILHCNGLDHIRVEMSRGGTLSDHYDPRAGVIRLSADIYQGTSIASLSVAAHECGHAIQHKENYAPLKIRDTMVPVVNLANQIGWVALFLGLVLFYRSSTLLMVGGIMLLVVLAFQLITLPVFPGAQDPARGWHDHGAGAPDGIDDAEGSGLYLCGQRALHAAADLACLFDRGITRPSQLADKGDEDETFL